MVMDISGTALATTAVAASRKVIKKLEVCWDGSSWTDESAYLQTENIDEVGSKSWVWGESTPTEAVFNLFETTGRFSYFNTSSPLYAYIGASQGRNIEVRFSVGFWDSIGGKYDYIRQFTGYIDYIGFGTASGSYVLHCMDGALKQKQNKASTIMYINQTVSDWLTVLCGADIANIT